MASRPTTMMTPANAIPMPAQKRRLRLSWKMSNAPRLTQIVERLPSRVELAADVNYSDVFQTARSPAKKRPASAVMPSSGKSQLVALALHAQYLCPPSLSVDVPQIRYRQRPGGDQHPVECRHRSRHARPLAEDGRKADAHRPQQQRGERPQARALHRADGGSAAARYACAWVRLAWLTGICSRLDRSRGQVSFANTRSSAPLPLPLTPSRTSDPSAQSLPAPGIGAGRGGSNSRCGPAALRGCPLPPRCLCAAR